MPDLPYISEKRISNKRRGSRRDYSGPGRGIEQAVDLVEGSNTRRNKRRQESEEFNAKIKVQETKNEIDTAGINTESELLVLQANFNADPTAMSIEDYRESRGKIVEKNALTVKDLAGQDLYRQNEQIGIVKRDIEAVTNYNVAVLNQGKEILQRNVDRISGATIEGRIAELNNYVGEANGFGLLKGDEAYKMLDDAKVGFAESDVTNNPYTAPQVIEDLKAGKYGIEDNNKLKKAISSVSEISLREKKILDLNTKLGEVEAQKIGVGIAESDLPYRKKKEQLENVKGLTENTKKELNKQITDNHVIDAKTDKDVFNGFILELGTIDSKSDPDASFSDSKDYLDRVKKLKDRVISKRRSLSTQNYNQIMEDIEEKTSVKMGQSISKVAKDDSFMDIGGNFSPSFVNFEYSDANAQFTNTFMGDEDLTKEANIEYYYRTRGKKLSNDEKREKANEVQTDLAKKVRTRIEGIDQDFSKPKPNYRHSMKLGRPDISAGIKGDGFFGPIPTPDGRHVSSELSRAKKLYDNKKNDKKGEMVSYPLLNPYLSNEEIVYTLMGEPNRAVEKKAEAWAIHRRRQGKSPFLEEGKDKMESRVTGVQTNDKTGQVEVYFFKDGPPINVKDFKVK